MKSDLVIKCVDYLDKWKDLLYPNGASKKIQKDRTVKVSKSTDCGECSEKDAPQLRPSRWSQTNDIYSLQTDDEQFLWNFISFLQQNKIPLPLWFPYDECGKLQRHQYQHETNKYIKVIHQQCDLNSFQNYKLRQKYCQQVLQKDCDTKTQCKELGLDIKIAAAFNCLFYDVKDRNLEHKFVYDQFFTDTSIEYCKVLQTAAYQYGIEEVKQLLGLQQRTVTQKDVDDLKNIMMLRAIYGARIVGDITSFKQQEGFRVADRQLQEIQRQNSDDDFGATLRKNIQEFSSQRSEKIEERIRLENIEKDNQVITVE